MITLIVLAITTSIDFVKKVSGRGGAATTNQVKGFLMKQKRTLEDVGIIEKSDFDEPKKDQDKSS